MNKLTGRVLQFVGVGLSLAGLFCTLLGSWNDIRAAVCKRRQEP